MSLTPAHEKSAPFVYDPAYSAEKPFPEDPHIYEAPYYLYGKGELEAFLLQKMHKETAKARLLVGYPGDFLSPSPCGYFRAKLPAGSLTFLASGHVILLFNGKTLYSSAHKETPHHVILPAEGEVLMRLFTFDANIDLPALLVHTGGEWEFGRTEKAFSPCVPHPRRKDGIPPHLAPFSEVELTPKKIGKDLWDMGFEVLGVVEINGVINKPSLFVGETLYEVENEDPRYFEQTLELEETKTGYRSCVPLAFRYLRVTGLEEGEIKIRAQYPSLSYKGAFAADEELTKICLTGAYTLKLCTRNFAVDGIKRDRLPWMGDLAVSMMSNAYTFADKGVITGTIRILESGDLSRCRDINGIVDYSLWQLICHDRYQLYFKDMDFLREEYGKILERVEDLLARRDANGFLTEDCSWLLIDWCKDRKEEKFSALQILFFWALKCAERLAERMDDFLHKKIWEKASELLEKNIYIHFFVEEKGLFAADPEKSTFRRHGNMFAILSGLVKDEKTRKELASALAGDELPPIGTPYMGIMESWALTKAGFREAALNRIRRTWGGMLKEGATTFFEAFDETLKGEKLYEFYNRPYGLSCCHAWGSGPAFLVPLILSGIEPLKDGWEEFALSPMEGMEEFFVTIPTPRGLIRYNVEKGVEDLIVPDGLKALRK